MGVWWVLLPCLLVPVSARPGYILTVPKVVTAGETEQLSLTTFELPVSQPIDVRLLSTGGTTLAETRALVVNGLTSWLELNIPQGTPSEATIQVLADFPDLSINQTRSVRVRPSSLVVLIQTDKSIYLPGQTVKFRIAPLGPSLKPVSRYTEAQVWIENPATVRVVQWNAVRFHEAIVQLELPLVAEPPLGQWAIVCKISGREHRKTFQVSEYVLPKFEVTINAPPYVLVGPSQISSWEVCARYTYGKAVEGKISLELLTRWNKWTASSPFVFQSSVPADGCTQFNVSSTQLLQEGLHLRGQDAKTVTATAVASEKETGLRMTSETTVPVLYPRFKLEFLNQEKYIRPGLPQLETLKVTTSSGEPVESEPLRVCVLYSEHPSEFCKNLFTDPNGFINFTFTGKEKNPFVDITAATSTRRERVFLRHQLQTWVSPTGHYLQLLPHTAPLACHRLAHITAVFTWPSTSDTVDIQFHHQVTARGKLVQKGSHWRNIATSLNKTQPGAEMSLGEAISGLVGEFSFTFVLRGDYSAVTLLVYYVLPGGEIVADTRSFPVEPCFSHTVELEFESPQQSPGTPTSLKVQAAPNSICGLTAVDHSVELLRKGGAILSAEQLFSQMEQQHSNLGDNPQCEYIDPLIQPRMSTPLRRSRRYLYVLPRKVLDFHAAFEDAGLMVLTNLAPERKQECYNYPTPIPFLLNKSMGPHSGIRDSPPPSAKIREIFPETWLWSLSSTDENGTTGLEATLPDTITSWKAQALCIHRGKLGIGLSPPTSITAFQPFFLRLNLPYSIVQGEILPLKVSLFNYLDYCLAVRLSLEPSPHLVLEQGGMSRKVCACGGRSTVETFVVRPTAPGPVNVTVHALSLPSDLSCGGPLPPETPDPVSDAVRRTLLVKSEGFPKEEVTNSMICPNDHPDGFLEKTISLVLPREVVPGSVKAYIYVSGDIVSPSLQGLEKLVQMPTGCGEQNMALLAPNIGVLDYLRAAGKLSVELQARLLNNLQHGYQRQLNYLRRDNSYSAFGEHDGEGSTWLTAFVIRGLYQASKHIFVDLKSLELSKSWILSSQLENGCFPNKGRLLQPSNRGGFEREAEETLVPLTAYVLVSLLEAGLPSHHDAVTNAWQCLTRFPTASPHALAVISYAAVLSNHSSATERLRKLLETARRTKDEMWWTVANDPSKAVSIETAAYGLLAFMKHQGPHFIAHCPALVRWLANRRNSLGGFVSTQDTVVALQALSQYATWMARRGSDELDLTILVTGSDGLEKSFALTPFNRLVQYVTPVPRLPVSLELRAHGFGCAFLQTSVKYHVTKISQEPPFGLDVTSHRDPPNCKALVITVCSLYKLFASSSNMAIVDVEFLSGFSIDSQSLKKVINQHGSPAKRTEVKDGHAFVYYDKMENERHCFNLTFTPDVDVQHRKPATVTVYDYYEPTQSAVQIYEAADIEDCEARKSLLEPVEAWTGKFNEEDVELVEPVQTVVDHELDFSDGLLESRPMVVPVPAHFSTPAPVTRCPKCWETFPLNFNTIYCSASQVFRLVVLDPDSQVARVETDVSPHLSRPRPVTLRLRYLLPANCPSCQALLQRGQYIYVILEIPQELREGSAVTLEGPKIHIIPTSTRIVEPKPVVQARQTCPPPPSVY